ncbi:MAG: hypothetical protein ACRDVM_06385, partial [Acidimicrobiia bacterium]
GVGLEDLAGSLVLLLPGAIGAVLVLAWVLAMEVDELYAFVYSGTMSAAPHLRWVPGPVLAATVAAAILTGSMLVPTELLVQSAELAVAVLAPVVVVALVDFYVIRGRDYSIDDLYAFSGYYRPVNLWGGLAAAVGFMVGQWADPVGPSAWTEMIGLSNPFGEPLVTLLGLPGLLTSMLVAGGLYLALGRWRIRRREYVSTLRGI